MKKLIFAFLLIPLTHFSQGNKISFAPYVKLEVGAMKNYSNQFAFFGLDMISPSYFLSGGLAFYNRLDLGFGIGIDGLTYQHIPSYRFEAGYKFLPNSILSPTLDLELGGNFPSPKNYAISSGYYISGKAGLTFNFDFAPNFNFNLSAGYRKWNLNLAQDFYNESVLRLNSITTTFGITYHFNHPKK